MKSVTAHAMMPASQMLCCNAIVSAFDPAISFILALSVDFVLLLKTTTVGVTQTTERLPSAPLVTVEDGVVAVRVAVAKDDESDVDVTEDIVTKGVAMTAGGREAGGDVKGDKSVPMWCILEGTAAAIGIRASDD